MTNGFDTLTANSHGLPETQVLLSIINRKLTKVLTIHIAHWENLAITLEGERGFSCKDWFVCETS